MSLPSGKKASDTVSWLRKQPPTEVALLVAQQHPAAIRRERTSGYLRVVNAFLQTLTYVGIPVRQLPRRHPTRGHAKYDPRSVVRQNWRKVAYGLMEHVNSAVP